MYQVQSHYISKVPSISICHERTCQKQVSSHPFTKNLLPCFNVFLSIKDLDILINDPVWGPHLFYKVVLDKPTSLHQCGWLLKSVLAVLHCCRIYSKCGRMELRITTLCTQVNLEEQVYLGWFRTHYEVVCIQSFKSNICECEPANLLLFSIVSIKTLRSWSQKDLWLTSWSQSIEFRDD